jgi:CMP/dCMP kinase
MIITIDGPCASGKSTVASLLAQKLNYYYVYTGLLYRAVAYILHTHYQLNDDQIENASSDDIVIALCEHEMVYYYSPKNGPSVQINKKNVTTLLKTPLVDHIASIIGTNHAARDYLTNLQKEMCMDKKNVILDGRDSGSAVFPNADLKIYLTASVEVRVTRWLLSQANINKKYTHQEALNLIQKRDNRDSERENSPLVIPENALVIDNSAMSIDETISLLLLEIEKAEH